MECSILVITHKELIFRQANKPNQTKHLALYKISKKIYTPNKGRIIWNIFFISWC